MLKRLSILAIVILLGSLSRNAIVEGGTLPQSYPLVGLTKENPQTTDPNLEHWLAAHRDVPSPLERSKGELRDFLAKQDPLVEAFVEVMLLNKRRRSGEPRVNQTDSYKRLRQSLFIAETKSGEVPKHPLAPWAYHELMLANDFQGDDTAHALASVFQLQKGCVHKKLIFEELVPERMQSMSPDSLVDVLNRVDRFHSTRFKKNALNKFLAYLPKGKRDVTRVKLYAMTERHQDLRNLYDWIEESPALEGKSKGVMSDLAEAESAAKRKHCTSARDSFQKALIKVSSVNLIDQAMKTAGKIEACFRKRGSEARRGFWVSVERPMEKAFGFDGWAKSKLRLGYLYWTVDKFKEAKATFHAVIMRAKQAKEIVHEADAYYALARIAENEGDPVKAIEYYSKYVQDFPRSVNHYDALRALVLLHGDNNDSAAALSAANQIIEEQVGLDQDARSLGPHAFSLFWAGRLHLQLGHVELAKEMWRQVATEYYSTYYGAISHYMLEEVGGQKLALEPARSGQFRMHQLIRTFSEEEKDAIRRAEALLRLGLREEAHCEVSEISYEGSPEQQAVVALLLHASGEWLEAIKTYDSIPRSYRNSLAVGFERILFPRRYVDKIQDIAAKLAVDPDLVFAVIRQESVFDRMARSPAGARGLMQLMPATAKLEASRLKSSFLDKGKRQQLRTKVRNRNNLYEAETNLALGIHHLNTLISTYKSPVFVLTAYNASPRATKRWQESIPTEDILSFIERIPYNETRDYVKLILRNYFYYKRWYRDGQNELPHLAAVTKTLLNPVIKTARQEGDSDSGDSQEQ